MKRIIQSIRSHPARFYLALFILLIIPALLLYPVAESGDEVGMGFLLALIILANGAALFF
jgi:NADH:ubiquinone oxidoreductase subunit 3 (subunit A)